MSNNIKNTKNPGRKAYYDNITTRLSNRLTELHNQGRQMSIHYITERIRNDFKIETSEQKIRAIFNHNDREIPLAEMVALCHILEIPLFDTSDFEMVHLSGLDTPNHNKEDLSDGGITSLSNELYYGTYYCYHFERRYLDNSLLSGNTQANTAKINMGKLDIYEKNGQSYAKYEESYLRNNFSLQDDLVKIHLEGRVFFFPKKHKIYIMLTDKNGKYIFSLLFDYQDYNNAVMYYRTAALTTISVNFNNKPLFQKMALFRKKQDLDDYETQQTIRGILTLNANNIIIEQQKFKQLISEDYELELLNKHADTYYSFNEAEILNSRLPWSYNEKMNKILKLRQNSISPSFEIIADDENFNIFAKEMQQSNTDPTDNS